jgi:hypothetical protein
MRYVIEFFALLVGLPLLLRYYKARPGILRRPPPRVFTRWSRQSRLTFVWVSLILTVVVAVPACLLPAFLVLDADTCTHIISTSWPCYESVRYVVAAILLGATIIGALKWAELLSQVQNYGKEDWTD